MMGMTVIVRYALIVLGVISLGLGLVGAVLPVMPTTPFLIVAALCFVRSSKRLHAWLTEHPLFGGQVRDYLAGHGIPLRAKYLALASVWLAIPTSGTLTYLTLGAVPLWYGALAVLLGSAIFATWYLFARVPTRPDARVQ